MAKHEAFRSSRHVARVDWYLSLVVGLLAVASAFFGTWLLWRHGLNRGVPYQGPAGVILVLLSLIKLRTAWRLARGSGCGLWFYRLNTGLSVRWLLLGPLVGFFVALACGPDPAAVYVFAAALAAWYAALIAPLGFAPRTVDAVSRRLNARWAVSAQQAGFAAALLVFSAEVGLRTLDAIVDGQPATGIAARAVRLPPGLEYQGRTVNQLGYWDHEFLPDTASGRFRVAAVGNRGLLSGTASTNYLLQVERSVPNVELLHFGIAHGGPGAYSTEVMRDVVRVQPDMVLAFVSVADDLLLADQHPGTFDWRTLRLCQWLQPAGMTARVVEPQTLFAPAPSYESYLHSVSGTLAVCRTPISPAMQQQWNATKVSLDRIVRQCRRRGIAVGLVLVPSEFQVDGLLFETLCRRAGYQSHQVDRDLPQRQLISFAQSRELPVLDLLPPLRAAEQSPYRRHSGDFNEQGHEIASHVVSGWLQSRFATMLANNAQTVH